MGRRYMAAIVCVLLCGAGIFATSVASDAQQRRPDHLEDARNNVKAGRRLTWEQGGALRQRLVEGIEGGYLCPPPATQETCRSGQGGRELTPEQVADLAIREYGRENADLLEMLPFEVGSGPVPAPAVASDPHAQGEVLVDEAGHRHAAAPASFNWGAYCNEHTHTFGWRVWYNGIFGAEIMSITLNMGSRDNCVFLTSVWYSKSHNTTNVGTATGWSWDDWQADYRAYQSCYFVCVQDGRYIKGRFEGCTVTVPIICTNSKEPWISMIVAGDGTIGPACCASIGTWAVLSTGTNGEWRYFPQQIF